MSQVYNPESEQVARIERLEIDARNIRRRIEHARNEKDKRVLNRQIQDLEDEVRLLQERLLY